MKSLSTIIIVFLFASSIYGQGAYLERGQSGFGMAGGFSTNEDVTGIGGSVGYSLKGILDFGLSVESFSFDQKLLGADLSAIILSPSLAFYALKQNDEIPLSFAIGAGYDWQNYSNDVLDDFNVDMTGGFFSVGGSLFGYLKASESFRIEPSIGFSYVTGEVKLEDSDGNVKKENDDTTIFRIGLGLTFNAPPKNIFVISPSIGMSEGTTTFGVGLSFILGTN